MLLRRAALPLSLLALLASAGCVSVGPEHGAPRPARGSAPPAGAPDAGRPAPAPPARPLPLGEVPEPSPDPDPAPAPAPPVRKARPPAPRAAKPAPPRRARPPKPAPPRRAIPPVPRGEELCESAEGTLPPSIVDLCVRQYGS
ncbi:hypothetical protein BX286_1021 [Streptomyces sp. 3211.6]|uniref:hypothetical protein n=1 Tax=unclassified Streptomyces TaxID=2593676 RepID=UPI000C2B6212|nr:MULTISPECIES: hypothetical protein [unclassified Streptomyces]RKT03099.1 hypothetical protein BX286_1021 [Streptomyces sp. 3211.6]RPF29480.1 hypothetical protein EDD96_6004 [Streptomyces sp. Ag109_G2-6]